ncbi:methyltransferase regulatory domain-containing protein [Achromobacter sp. 77]|uniref:methyltransferase regulatory domain-containing protein n=1 Tax=Achromobacter sp. 77 TaxID=2756133 RepID=UPI001D01E34F|nr:methyltransferase regulatory domain-containing protein [Achromobacter sp. 77]UDG77742.1 methyltransferase regulatory domain-containing protein [Achromobacter sp. 77]
MSAPDRLTQAISDAYDETPYLSLPFSYTAPGSLRAVAHLYGISSPELNRARVLELGCAAGGNLLPFAIAYPDARAVGVDLSPQQIEAGQRAAEAAGARNLDLHAMSLTDITPEFGTFDYIICHGVFSWVPPEVRDAILRICKENLAPEGIAYISYNTYPGWKASDVLRDAMMLNSFGAQTPQEKVARAKDMLNLIENGLWENNPLQSALQHTAQKLRGQSDHYLLHEYLEAVNTPCYFLEFAAAAQQAGLAYLTDAEPQLTFPSTYGSRVALGLNGLAVNAGREMREQYLDFAVGRSFRKSLLVHAERAGAMLEQPEGGAFTKMFFAADLRPQPTPAGAPPQQRDYMTARGATLSSRDPVAHSLMDLLGESWPQSVTFDAIREAATANAPDKSGQELTDALLAHVIALVQSNALSYRLEPSSYGRSQPKPQLIAGALDLLPVVIKPDSQISMHNLWHQGVTPPSDPLSLHIIGMMDGSRTTAELRSAVRDALTAGRHPHPNGQTYKGARNLEPVAQEFLNSLMVKLRRNGLLLN